MPSLKEAESKMTEAVDAMRREFATVRTGKATPALLDTVRVDAYGTKMPLNQVATVHTPEPSMLVVQPYDKSSVGAIEKAIQSADLGLNPSNDGLILRLAFPPLNEERRRELIKLVRHMAEEGRVAIRNVRRHAKDQMEKLHGEVSDDDIHRGEKELQDRTDSFISRLDELVRHKEEELLEV